MNEQSTRVKDGSPGGPGSAAGLPAVELSGISKAFPGVVANNNISLSVWPGEVHCLLGENGAGKSTLMQILSGMYTRTGERSGYVAEKSVSIPHGKPLSSVWEWCISTPPLFPSSPFLRISFSVVGGVSSWTAKGP